MDWVNSCISHYNHNKFWKRKAVLADENAGTLQKLCCLLYLKRCESYNNASLGNRLDGGSMFMTPPFLPHGIKGIFVSDHAVIGENTTIYQQVTIGVKNPGGTDYWK